VPLVFDNFGRQRDIAGNYQIAGRQAPDDFIVGRIEFLRDLEKADVTRRFYTDIVVGDHCQCDSGAFGGTK